MDHDMLALCDLAPYFQEEFEGNLLMGRLFGPGNTLGVQMAQRGGLPESLRYAADYPYFHMGPMMNLKAMREEGTWEKLLAAHKELGQDEQMALTIATEGWVKGVGRKWNLVPHWDHLKDGPSGPERSLYGTAGDAAEWRNGLPEGIIHWTGWEKPWHHGSRVWRPDLWEAEETSWEALRNGWWDKPRAVEVEPRDFRDVNHLAKRGWRVHVVRQGPESESLAAPTSLPENAAVTSVSPTEGNRRSPAHPIPPTQDGTSGGSGVLPPEAVDEEIFYRPFPDVKVSGRESEAGAQTDSVGNGPKPDLNLGSEMVRFGIPSKAAAWLKGHATLPHWVVLRGPASKRETASLSKLGYGGHCLIRRDDWPAGGPAPSVLDFMESLPLPAVRAGEDLYLALSHPAAGDGIEAMRGRGPGATTL